MIVCKNIWGIDTKRIIDSIAKRCKIVGRSTAKTASNHRVFQGFLEASVSPSYYIISKMWHTIREVIEANNRDNVDYSVWINGTNLDDIEGLGILRMWDEKQYNVRVTIQCPNDRMYGHCIISWDITLSDDQLAYINCQYAPADTLLTWEKEERKQKAKDKHNRKVARRQAAKNHL